jgi:hypothetical protein
MKNRSSDMTREAYEAKANRSSKLARAAQYSGDVWLIKFHSDMQTFWLSMAAMKSVGAQ